MLLQSTWPYEIYGPVFEVVQFLFITCLLHFTGSVEQRTAFWGFYIGSWKTRVRIAHLRLEHRAHVCRCNEYDRGYLTCNLLHRSVQSLVGHCACLFPTVKATYGANHMETEYHPYLLLHTVFRGRRRSSCLWIVSNEIAASVHVASSSGFDRRNGFWYGL